MEHGHDDVAYLRYTDLVLEDKSAEEVKKDAEIFEALIARHTPIPLEHLGEVLDNQEKEANIEKVVFEFNQDWENHSSTLIEEKLTLSARTI